MKLSYEERTALKTGISKFKTLLSFVLLSQIIYPQIPFKGFCKLNSFSVDSGFTKIFSFNYNQDGHSDLLIYNPLQKKAALYDGISGTEFILKEMLTLPLELSSIEPIIVPNKTIESFAFTSRKSRSFGIYNFNTSGKVKLISQIKFDSYPENIGITNNPSDDTQLFLLSGNSFDGLSIVSSKNNQLIENKISANKPFLNAQFIDLNSDGYEDIAALNSIDNKLHLFYNNSRNEFKELRTLRINDDVLSMRMFDINYDQYEDIIVSTKSNIQIYFGDATSSFGKTIYVQTTYPVDKFIIGDFNRDGFFDINYLSIDEGIVSTIFAKDFNMFFPEIIQQKKKGIVDVIPFFSKFVYGAAYLNQNGEVNILSKVTSMTESQKLAIAIEPDLIAPFDHTDNGITDLVFTDKFDKKLKFIVRSAAGLPEKYFAVDLYDDHNKILEFSYEKSKKTFFLYSSNKRIIETIEVDFDNYNFKRKIHYAEGPIQDIKIKPDAEGEAELFALYSKDKTLNLQVISKTPVGFNQKVYTNLSSNLFNAFLFFDDKLTIGYWQYDEEFLKLNFISFTEDEQTPLTKLKLNRKNSLLVSRSNSIFSKDSFKYSALLKNEYETFMVAVDKEPKLYSIINFKNEFRIQDKNQLFFGKNNSLFVYDSNLSSLIEITAAKTGGSFLMAEKITDIKLNNYIIQQLDQRKLHLIFTDTKSGSIEIRQLSK
ncbi:MAG TPA: VCBS repeat-containing protein [Ignavibacteriaceae bacterium]|nr:VCBS repeat-containing protein [Ignavibacteriaceae bacterium]